MRKGSAKLETRKLVAELEKTSRKRKEKVWMDVAKRLKKPRRGRAAVNLWQINILAKSASNKGRILLVPGKVLGYGNLNEKADIAALEFSTAAKNAIEKNGSALTLGELLEKKVKPGNVVIVG